MPTPRNSEFKQRSRYYKQRRRQCRLIQNKPNTSFVSAANGAEYHFDSMGTVHRGGTLVSDGLLDRIRGMFRA